MAMCILTTSKLQTNAQTAQWMYDFFRTAMLTNTMLINSTLINNTPTPPPNYVLRKIAEKPVASSYSTWQPHYPMPTQRSPAAPITPSGVSFYPPKSESPKSIPGQFPLKRDDLHGILKNYIPGSTFYQLDKESSKNRSSFK